MHGSQSSYDAYQSVLNFIVSRGKSLDNYLNLQYHNGDDFGQRQLNSPQIVEAYSLDTLRETSSVQFSSVPQLCSIYIEKKWETEYGIVHLLNVSTASCLRVNNLIASFSLLQCAMF